MNKILLKGTIYLAIISLFLTACTKNFEGINTSEAGITNDYLKADFKLLTEPLITAQRNLINATNWIYQLQQNLNSDIYSGYLMSPTDYNGNKNNINYFMMDVWNHRVFYTVYGDILPNFDSYEKNKLLWTVDNVSFAHSDGMVEVLKVIAMHKIADKMGPIIYSKIGIVNSDLSVDYDSQQEAYTKFFADLDNAMTLFNAQVGIPGKKVLDMSDRVYGGDVVKWKKLINTLRLRLALRIVYADATKAKTEGEKALNPANGGLLEINEQNAFVDYKSAHPINDIINSWDDIRAGASMMTYLKGYNDPRLTKYALPATSTSINGQYVGIRSGINISSKGDYTGFSKPDANSAIGNYFDKVNGKAKISTASEAYFLKAEAALRGWANAGNAKTNYEQGVTLSFAEWGVSGEATYLANNTLTQAPYSDFVNAANNVAAGNALLSTATVMYDEAGSFENKLEKIITQKWIACYPDADEAWAEVRRTKYPKLFPVMVNNSTVIPAGGFINRLPIPNQDYQTNNPKGYQGAVTKLGGPDNENTKVWWDKK